MGEVFLKASSVYRLEVYPPHKCGSYEWINGGYNRKNGLPWGKKIPYAAGWKKYDYSSPRSTEEILAANNDLSFINDEFWYRPYLDVSYAVATKNTYNERIYFDTLEEARITAEQIAKDFPHIVYQRK